MTLEDFRSSLSQKTPPSSVSEHLRGLWFDAKGDWHSAHTIIQDINDGTAAWIHAYLHRKEGDIWNADYWYSNAGKKRPSYSLEKEWEEIVSALL